ncbi:MAG: hypothetical protein U0163_13565 [Gemmatimonadaceae bacterium]
MPFLRHLVAGIKYARSRAARLPAIPPGRESLQHRGPGQKLNELVELAVLPDERVLFERHGAINLYLPVTGCITKIGAIDVSTKYTSGDWPRMDCWGWRPTRLRQQRVAYMYHHPPAATPRTCWLATPCTGTPST